MSKKEVVELKEMGHFIGGHSMNHPHFSDLTESERLDQITGSVNYCNKEFTESLRLFAFPFYDFNIGRQTFENLFDADIDLSFGTSGLNLDQFERSLQRLDMEVSSNTPAYLKKKIFYYLVKKAMNQHVIRR